MRNIKSRTAFTMIELVFVIMILGILATVAIAKYFTLSEQTTAQVCNAAVGTMNRTVAETLWARSINDGNAGAIESYSSEVVPKYITWPEVCGGENTIESVVSGTDAVVVIAGTNYDLKMVNGNDTTSPIFSWTKQ